MEDEYNCFNQDIKANQGYRYTNTEQLSCRLSNQRMSDELLRIVDYSGKTLLDIGCGDGFYTVAFHDRCKSILGVDAAEQAIALASGKYRQVANLSFQVCSAYELRSLDRTFDIASIRGVLHHLDRPMDALEEASKIASTVVLLEPNGYNPVVKLIEKLSPYHRQHKEKSYPPRQLDRWCRASRGVVIKRSFIGLVPMFCPDMLARTLKWIEPFIEKTPLIRKICCGQYVSVVQFH